jgi:hypothetical protein
MRNIERDQRRLVLEGLAITSSKVRFIASQVWPGSRFQDLSISEISIQGSSKGNGTAKNRDLTRVLPKKTAGFKRQASKQPGERVRRRYRPQEW